MRTRLVALLGAMMIAGTACGDPAPSPTSGLPATPGPTTTAAAVSTPAPSPTAATATPAPTPAPSPTASAAVSWPSPSPSQAPSSPKPSASPSAPSVAATSPLVRANAASIRVRLAPAPGGRLFVAVPSKKGTVVALLDARGRVRRGWPVLLRRATGCELDAVPADGSVRAVCTVRGRMRAYALDAAGRRLAGWPVNLPAGTLQTWMSDPVRVVNRNLYAILFGRDAASAVLARVSRDGSLHRGTRVIAPASHSFASAVIGPDGTGYVTDLDDGTGLWAFDLDGVRPGFPFRIDDWASSPAFGPGGRLYLTADSPDDSDDVSRSSRVLALTAGGKIVPGWPVTLPISTWTAFGDPTSPPVPPVVGSDGSVYVTGGLVTKGTVVYALRPSGARRPGWPYHAAAGIRTGGPGVVTCSCEPCIDPLRFIDTLALAGPGRSLVLVQSVRDNVGGHNRIVAVRPDGRLKSGWPVTLSETASWFASIAGTGRSVYGFAVEPAATRRNRCGETYQVSSGTVVALDGHGDTIYTTTLVAP
jgi:hypothetical protein